MNRAPGARGDFDPYSVVVDNGMAQVGVFASEAFLLQLDRTRLISSATFDGLAGSNEQGVLVVRSSVRVLIVDDIKQFRAAARLIVLGELGAPEITESADGRSAVRLAEQLQPDLILLDIGLPELNGIQAAKQIKKISPASKIIFVTQNNDHEIRDSAFELGAQAYVAKVNAARELPIAIRNALREPSESGTFESDLSGQESQS